MVWSDRLKIAGIIDAVESQKGNLCSGNTKKGKMAQHLNDHFQLCGAALCLEERTGRGITYGEIFTIPIADDNRSLYPELRQATENAIALAHLLLREKCRYQLNNTKKCQSCSLQRICLTFEVKALRSQ
ncbi:Dna2/Cas4 domain-containing protein [Scytonema sp. UIC 10036]|uniref:CRISPR-associated protein Cas4 n=1 Tax=Scytonema sp. UIC 10036 TaxID=2304196 RepID=UPI001FA9AC74|nr:Dna2/Cas4 domain-containing protein [Scytonema sp. UIC 10036]